MRPLEKILNVILSASEGSGFSIFSVEREILHPALGGVQNDKVFYYIGT